MLAEKKNSRTLLVGLTGGIGSGKSMALKEFNRLGAASVSSDEIAREVVRPGRPAYRRIVSIFGRGILGPDGEIVRARLGRLVFSDARRRRELEALVHPAILREMRGRLRRASAAGKRVIVADVPLLFERGLQDDFDLTLLVCAAARRRAFRVMRRDGLSRAEARRRLASQWSDARKRGLADVAVPNEGSPKEFLRRIGQYYRAFALMAGRRDPE